MEGQKTFAAGEVIFVEGEPGDFIYIVGSGEVLLLKEEGGKVSPFSKVEAKGFFGELSSFTKRSVRSLSAVALRETIVYQISIDDIKKAMNICPEWVSEIMQLLSERLKSSTEVIKEHRIVSDSMEQLSARHTQNLLTYQEEIKKYRQENGLNL